MSSGEDLKKVINIYAPNERASKYEVKSDRTAGRNRGLYINSGDFNTPLSIMGRTTRWKIRKERT